MTDFNIDFWLLNDEKSITVYDNDIARVTSIEEAVFIRRILYLWKKFNKQPIFIIPEKFCTPVGISIYSFRKIAKQWESDNLIKTECKDLPLKKYYIINETNLAAYLNKLKYSDFEQRNISYRIQQDESSYRIQQDELTNSTRYPIDVLNKMIKPGSSTSAMEQNQNINTAVRGVAPSGKESNPIQEGESYPRDKNPIQEGEVLTTSEKRHQKIFKIIVERIKNLSSSEIIPKYWKLNTAKKSLIDARIREFPNLPFWNELFDKIEEDGWYYSTVHEWFGFNFIFRPESNRAESPRHKIMNGFYYHQMRKIRPEAHPIENATPPPDEPMYTEPKPEQMFQELRSMVSDKIMPDSDKEGDLADIVDLVWDFATPMQEIKVAGQTTRGYCDFKQNFGSYWYEVYQEHVRKYAAEHNMPVALVMIKIGSECWNSFERLVLKRFTYCDSDKIPARLACFEDLGRYF